LGKEASTVRTLRSLFATSFFLLLSAIGPGPVAAAPEGQMTWGIHISLAPTWFDPAETPGIATPFMILYALHDALVKPMPGNAMAPSLAESWSLSKDGLVQEFVLRQGVKFHNGEPVTADDVKFSFERYRGAANKVMKDKVAAVEVVDPGRVRFRFKEPWPDFMTYYGSLTTGAGWIVPRKYLEKVGDDGFKRAPVGAGPYRFVSFNPGVELVLEANESYWRKSPSVKRLVLKSIPDEATRLAMLKRGEADVVYLLQSALAEEARRTAGLTLRPTPIVSTHWLAFLDQWDPKSPWADRRVRLAANHAIDRQVMNEAITLGFSRITWSIIPQSFDFYWQPPAYPYPQGEAAPRRGRLPERVRRRRLLVRTCHRHHERGGDRLPAGGGDSREAQAARAGGLLQGVPGEEAEGHRLHHNGRVRKRGHPHRDIRGLRRYVRIRRLP